jgi:hypothetical protein
MTIEQGPNQHRFTRRQKAALAGLAGLAAVTLSSNPADTPSVASAKSFVHRAVEGTTVGYVFKNGGFETSIDCNTGFDGKKLVIPKDDTYISSAKPTYFRINASPATYTFHAAIDGGNGAIFNVDVEMKDDVADLYYASPTGDEKSSAHTGKVTDAKPFIGENGLLDFGIAKRGGEYMVALACNDAYMQHFIDGQNGEWDKINQETKTSVVQQYQPPFTPFDNPIHK